MLGLLAGQVTTTLGTIASRFPDLGSVSFLHINQLLKTAIRRNLKELLPSATSST